MGNTVSIVADLTVYKEICLPSRWLESDCKPRYSIAVRRGQHKNSLIYCCVLGLIYTAVAWENVDQICYNILSVVTGEHKNLGMFGWSETDTNPLPQLTRCRVWRHWAHMTRKLILNSALPQTFYAFKYFPRVPEASAPEGQLVT
jgi:hypothetical protein